MAARLNTGHKEPQIPKGERATTGKPIWYVAPIRPVRQTKQAEIVYPIQTQIQDCHHERPYSVIIELEIIHVLMLNESAGHSQPDLFHQNIMILTNPESNIIPRAPHPPPRLHGFQIHIREHQLGARQALITLHGQFVRPPRNPAIPNLLHHPDPTGPPRSPSQGRNALRPLLPRPFAHTLRRSIERIPRPRTRTSR